MKHIRFTTIILSILFIMLPILTVLMFHHITVSETLANMDSGVYGKYYELLATEEALEDPAIIYKSAEEMNINCAITADSGEGAETIRSIYFTKTYANFPMKEGRFFTKNDFTVDNPKAVVGKGKIAETYLRDSVRYILVGDVEFEVIGILGYESDTILDNTIFINGMMQNQVFTSSLYTMDFMDDDHSEETMEDLLKQIEKQGVKAERLSGGSNFMNTVFSRVMYSRWFSLLLFADILCILLLSLEWVQQQKRELGIRRLLGASLQQLLLLILKRYFILILLSVTIAVLYTTFFYPNYRQFLIKGYAFLLPILILFLIGMVKQILQYPLEEVIK